MEDEAAKESPVHRTYSGGELMLNSVDSYEDMPVLVPPESSSSVCPIMTTEVLLKSSICLELVSLSYHNPGGRSLFPSALGAAHIIPELIACHELVYFF